MSFTSIGKKMYVISRQEDNNLSNYVDGEWVAPIKKEFKIKANIQPSSMLYQSNMLPSGEREKESINIYSNQWLYVARTGSKPLEADIVSYRGALWKVVVSRPYSNFGDHCEAMAVKLDDSLIERIDGTMGVSECR